jgi:hypothetical protein
MSDEQKRWFGRRMGYGGLTWSLSNLNRGLSSEVDISDTMSSTDGIVFRFKLVRNHETVPDQL